MLRLRVKGSVPSGGRRALALGLLAWALGPLAAMAAQVAERPASCSSEGRPRPQALMERFISADCEACWGDPATPAAPAGTLALDWVVPGARGEEAPLSAVALPEAAGRLAGTAGATSSGPASSGPALVVTRSLAPADRTRQQSLRVALGLPINDYVGTSVRLRPAGTGPVSAWVLLVERLPAGTEGSPVERRLVRGVFRPDWDMARPGQAPTRLEDLRPMRVPEGARAERLELVAWTEDGQGRPRAIALADCGRPGPSGPRRQKR